MSKPQAMTVGAYLARTARQFSRAKLYFGHGTHNARDEASWLLLHTLGLPLDHLAPHIDRQLSAAETRRLDAIVAERIGRRVPAAYLTHEAWLGEFSFYVDPRSIIPRSFIAELLRDGLDPWLRGPVQRVLDLCTGSGCLAILAAHAFPGARVDASDLSVEALAVARRNIRRYRLGKRVRALKSDLYAGLGKTRYDVILCNPPYVDAAAMRALPQEYRHEPRIALAGGRDGLSFVRRILAGAVERLEPGGLLVCEIGHNRRVLERAYPALPFVWLQTSAGPDHVFMIEREQLAAAPKLARRSMPRISRPSRR